MLADDSAVIRGFTRRWLEEDPDIVVVGAVGDGLQAVKNVGTLMPEVLVLDIEMPGMDGLTALPLLLRASPNLKIVMSSTLTVRSAEISMKALSLGAADYVAKPTSTAELQASDTFRRDLRAKVKVLGDAYRRIAGNPVVPATASSAAKAGPSVQAAAAAAPVRLRPAPPAFRPEVLAIGSSTGGPQALASLFAMLRGGIRQPIFITQHMPPTFTGILASHLAREAGLPAAEAKDGEPVVGGRIYVAPGDWHMTVVADGSGKAIRLHQGAAENFCRPSVDPMLRSLAQVYGSRVLALILTGMGSDGVKGCETVAKAGGMIVAQDAATSVVWGMPGAAANAGLCSEVLPLKEIASALMRLAGGAAK